MAFSNITRRVRKRSMCVDFFGFNDVKGMRHFSKVTLLDILLMRNDFCTTKESLFSIHHEDFLLYKIPSFMEITEASKASFSS